MTLRSLGLTALDRAVAAKAILDDIRPKWNETPGFYNPCFSNEQGAAEILASIFGKGYFKTPPVFSNLSLVPFGGVISTLEPDLEQRLVNLRSALSTKGAKALRERMLRLALRSNGSLGISWVLWPQLGSDELDEQVATLASFDFDRVSCLYGKLPNELLDDGQRMAHMVARVAREIDSKKSIESFLMTLTLAANPPFPVTGLNLISMGDDDIGKSHLAMLKSIVYPKGSTCGDLLEQIK